MKILKFGIKNTLFGCFGQHFLKKYSHIWNQHSRIFLISNWVFLGWNFNKLCRIWNQRPRILLLQKQKFLNLDSKMPCLGFYGSRFQKLLPYLKSAPSNLSYSKILYKNKISYIWDQKYLILVFLGWNCHWIAGKQYCHVWNYVCYVFNSYCEFRYRAHFF